MSVGYGYFFIEGKDGYAHRFSWEHHYGPIPEGLCVLHRCDNRMCVNPAHLFLGTRADNQQDAADKGRMPHGEAHWATKLTEAQVMEVVGLLASGQSHSSIARVYGVSRQAITNISLGRRRSLRVVGGGA